MEKARHEELEELYDDQVQRHGQRSIYVQDVKSKIEGELRAQRELLLWANRTIAERAHGLPVFQNLDQELQLARSGKLNSETAIAKLEKLRARIAADNQRDDE